MDKIVNIVELEPEPVLKEYLLTDEKGAQCGSIHTDMPLVALREFLKGNNFEYKKHVVSAIKQEGYHAY